MGHAGRVSAHGRNHSHVAHNHSTHLHHHHVGSSTGGKPSVHPSHRRKHGSRYVPRIDPVLAAMMRGEAVTLEDGRKQFMIRFGPGESYSCCSGSSFGRVLEWELPQDACTNFSPEETQRICRELNEAFERNQRPCIGWFWCLCLGACIFCCIKGTAERSLLADLNYQCQALSNDFAGRGISFATVRDSERSGYAVVATIVAPSAPLVLQEPSTPPPAYHTLSPVYHPVPVQMIDHQTSNYIPLQYYPPPQHESISAHHPQQYYMPPYQ